MRLIDADSLETHEIYEGEWVRVVYADDIDDAPTVEAEPVRHGRWVEFGVQSINGDTAYSKKCSECGNVWLVMTNYCPNCGAKMDKG